MIATAWTIGHSTRGRSEFLGLLEAHGIEAVADVRRFPASRSHPEFNEPDLRAALHAAGLDYLWIPQLGGRRRPLDDSRNAAWRHPSFRGYADHLDTEEFAEGLTELLNLVLARRTAIMCAEAVWWRCHRALIADVLRTLGIAVVHILGPTKGVAHPYTAPARVVRGRLTYA